MYSNKNTNTLQMYSNTFEYFSVKMEISLSNSLCWTIISLVLVVQTLEVILHKDNFDYKILSFDLS